MMIKDPKKVGKLSLKKKKDRTVEEIVDSMNEEQAAVLCYLVFRAYEDGRDGVILPSTLTDRFKELGFPGYSEV